MPTRLLKDSIHQSERLNALSDFQFRLWVNLITYVDDYGRGDARPAIIKGICFPLRDRLTNADIDAALQALAGAGCVGLYEVDGKPYLYFPRWESHQNVRNRKSKYPAPPENCNMDSFENICMQMNTNVPVIQSNPNPYPNPNPIHTTDVVDAPKRAQSYSEDFERFWAAYPKKVGKKDAAAEFKKAKMDVSTLIDAVERQKNSSQWTKENGRYIPNPSTWLHQGRWDDEIYSGNDRNQVKQKYSGRDFFDD